MDNNSTETQTPVAKVDTRPWIERYRPANLDAVSHQSQVVAVLKNAVETGRLPHLLFYGPPGSGKTSVALALCRQLWSPTDWKRRVLELNASDERGISVVRDKIKQFASLSVSTQTAAQKSFFKKPQPDDDAAKAKSYPNPPFKIIILDEADTVTKDAQAALRRIIEATSATTRFILICNYVTRIIEPVSSRCAKFRFHALPPEAMRERLQSIVQAEGGDEATVEAVLAHAGGDMRKAVMTLQSLHSLGTTDPAAVADVCGLAPPDVNESVWNQLQQARTFRQVQDCLDDYCAAGYSARICLENWLDRIVEDSTLSDMHKSDIAIRIATAEANMVQGADEGLQLLTVGSLLYECQNKQRMAAAAN